MSTQAPIVGQTEQLEEVAVPVSLMGKLRAWLSEETAAIVEAVSPASPVDDGTQNFPVPAKCQFCGAANFDDAGLCRACGFNVAKNSW